MQSVNKCKRCGWSNLLKGSECPKCHTLYSTPTTQEPSQELVELLKEILDSDMAQREEDEGEVSPLLDKIRQALSAMPVSGGNFLDKIDWENLYVALAEEYVMMRPNTAWENVTERLGDKVKKYLYATTNTK